MADSSKATERLRSPWALVGGGGVGGSVLVAALTQHADPIVAISVVCAAALITLSYAVVEIVRIRTDRSSRSRLVSVLAELAKTDPDKAIRLAMRLEAVDRAEGLTHGQLGELLQDGQANSPAVRDDDPEPDSRVGKGKEVVPFRPTETDPPARATRAADQPESQ